MENFPKRIHVELNAVCNLSCPMCPRHFVEEKPGFMTWELWKKIIDESSQYEDVSIIPFWRGESLLHPEFNAFIEYASNKVNSIQFTTNGMLISEKNIDALLKMDFISISIHNKLGLKNAKWLLNQRKSSKPHIQISFVEGEKTIDKFMNEIILDSELGGFDRVRYFELHTEDGTFGANRNPRLEERIYCNKLNEILVIDVEGDISRCSYVWECEQELNVNKSSIYEIWHSKPYMKIRSKYPDQTCSKCDQWAGVTNGKLYKRDESNIVEYIL